MDSKNNSGEVVTERLKEILYWLDHASRTLSDANEIAHHMLTKIQAITNPTSQLKLKAVSLPDMEVLGRQFNSKITDVRQDFLQLVELSNLLDSEISTGGIKCPLCNGEGEVVEERIQREEDALIPYKEFIVCSDCMGKGVLNLPADLLHNVNMFVDSFKSVATSLTTS